MTPNPQITTVGICVDARRVSRYVVDLVDALQTRTNARVVLLVTTTRYPDASAGQRSTATLTSARTLLRLEKRMLRVLSPYVPAIRSRSKHVRSGTIDVARMGIAVIEPATDHATLSPMSIDLLLVLGRRAPELAELPVRIGTAFKFELDLRPGCNDRLIGFAPVLRKRSYTTLRVYRLHTDGTPPVIAVNGMNRTRPLFALNQAAIWGRAISIALSLVVQREAQSGRSAITGEPRDAAPDWKQVNTAQILTYPWVIGTRAARLRPRKWRWSVVTQRRSAAGWVGGSGFHVMQAPSPVFYADPFLYRDPRSQETFCFVEEFAPSVGRAHISVLRLEPHGWQRLGIALREPYHLSFPFLFTYEGELYMCPESCAAQVVSVYRCAHFPLKWERAATLLTNESAVDTVLFPRNGRWWMLTGIDRAPNPDHQSELHVLHAQSPLSEDWRPVPGNPVKLDCNGARNGGFLVDGEAMYRFGQVQSFEMYGNQLNVYRITQLDESGYAEEIVGRLAPPAGLGAIGMHTYSATDDWVAIDMFGQSEPLDD